MHAIGHGVHQNLQGEDMIYISSEDFTNQLFIGSIQNAPRRNYRENIRNVDILLIDDTHFHSRKRVDGRRIFHTFNTLYDAHKQIVVSERPPSQKIQSLKKGRSRFEWGLVTDIQPPDFETRMAILKKKVERDAIALPTTSITFWREDKINIRELEGALIRVVEYAKLIGKEITVDMVRDVLKDMIRREGEKKITIDIIQKRFVSISI